MHNKSKMCFSSIYIVSYRWKHKTLLTKQADGWSQTQTHTQ